MGFMSYSGSGFAQNNNQPAETPCDPEYFKSLKSRAWLEAQREITQNQNLIFKPDSVFEYTCFDLYVNELADHAKDMFSETKRWGEVPGIDDKSMDRALQAVVGDALKDYVDTNFDRIGGSNNQNVGGEGWDHDIGKITGDGSGGAPQKQGETYDLLGGRLNKPGQQNNSGGGGIGGSSSSGNNNNRDLNPRNEYNCNIMQAVWEEAKCMDFIHNNQNDGFYTFEEYRDSDDKRFLPRRCEKVPQWDPSIKAATVNGEPPDGTPWKEDEAESLLEKLDPQKCAQSQPIPTGVKVHRAEQTPKDYDEYVCVIPGCYYKPAGGSGAGQCSTSP